MIPAASIPEPDLRSVEALISMAPTDTRELAHWLKRLTVPQRLRVFVPAITERCIDQPDLCSRRLALCLVALLSGLSTSQRSQILVNLRETLRELESPQRWERPGRSDKELKAAAISLCQRRLAVGDSMLLSELADRMKTQAHRRPTLITAFDESDEFEITGKRAPRITRVKQASGTSAKGHLTPTRQISAAGFDAPPEIGAEHGCSAVKTSGEGSQDR